MKKSVQLLFVVAMLFSFSTIAYSAPGLYIGGNLGLAVIHDSELSSSYVSDDVDVNIKADNGFSIGGFLGYAFENGYRIEGELVYQGNNIDKVKASYLKNRAFSPLDGDVVSVAILANGYYDFNNDSRVTPFIGVGIGCANVAVNDVNFAGNTMFKDVNEDDTVFAYQFSAGVGFEVTESITLDLKYRHFATEDLDINNVNVEYSSNNLYTGIRFTF